MHKLYCSKHSRSEQQSAGRDVNIVSGLFGIMCNKCKCRCQLQAFSLQKPNINKQIVPCCYSCIPSVTPISCTGVMHNVLLTPVSGRT